MALGSTELALSLTPRAPNTGILPAFRWTINILTLDESAIPRHEPVCVHELRPHAKLRHILSVRDTHSLFHTVNDLFDVHLLGTGLTTCHASSNCLSSPLKLAFAAIVPVFKPNGRVTARASETSHQGCLGLTHISSFRSSVDFPLSQSAQ